MVAAGKTSWKKKSDVTVTFSCPAFCQTQSAS